MTEFRRLFRHHQAGWREAHGHPIGSQPIAPREGKPSRLLGSWLPLDYARTTGATFLTKAALDAARARTAFTEAHQSFDHQRLWADLLSSDALAFNLFGDLAKDLDLADTVVHAWWPDAPGAVSELRFAHSPGRFDPAYLNSLRAFDVAFVLDLDNGTQGVIAIDTKYHEKATREIPRPERLPRYVEVADRSQVLRPGATDVLGDRSEFAVTWLEHLLLLSMLQHESGMWTWGRYVVVHPAGNHDHADMYTLYSDFLKDRSTFESMTLEMLVDANVLMSATRATLRERYLPD